jgi:hypothetical protein
MEPASRNSGRPCADKLAEDLAKVREELSAYSCSSMEEEAQIGELKRLQERSREYGD